MHQAPQQPLVAQARQVLRLELRFQGLNLPILLLQGESQLLRHFGVLLLQGLDLIPHLAINLYLLLPQLLLPRLHKMLVLFDL